VPVSILVEEALDRMQPGAAAAGIDLSGDDAAGEVTVACDRRQLVSALVNLLDNAVKYSERGSAVELRGAIEGDRVVFEVRDHGIGIPRGDLDRIWERFYRVDQARSRETGGTGLGLSIVRHVVQVHGGEVGVTSREGQGSTFRITIPRASIDAATETQQREHV
ncbi:MAG TPA: ATP-binding protein, partial [Gaiellaceae bacterium]|nr:ATP-binding protein [Gaiellaceae bacterium]